MFKILPEENEFYAYITEQIEKVEKNGKVVLTKFLSLREQMILRHCIKRHHVFYDFSGGYENAERKRCLIYQQNLSIQKKFSITCFEIIYNKRYLTLTHRNVLGTLMSLQLERALFGDIVLIDDVCYFFISSDIEPVLLMDFKMINNVPISIKKYDELLEVIPKYIIQEVIVTSMRMDNLISHVYHVSRENAKKLVASNFVYKNFQLVSNPAVKCEVNDIVSVRKHGRFTVSKYIRKTKSNKYVLEIKIPSS